MGDRGTVSGSVRPGLTLFVVGINRSVKCSEILELFSQCGEVEKVAFDEYNRKGFCWVTFYSEAAVAEAMRRLQHADLKGTPLNLRVETGEHVPQRANYFAERSIKKTAQSREADTFHFCNDSLIVNNTQYPIPRGRYLLKLLRLCHGDTYDRHRGVIDLLTARKNFQEKELTESLSMVDAFHKVGYMTNTNWLMFSKVIVYVLGDGITPFTAAAMALFLPLNATFHSIDPIMNFDVVASMPALQGRLQVHPLLSQQFSFEDQEISAQDGVAHVIVACHSHAPLQEFWDRTPSPKFAMSLPCCGKGWSLLSHAPFHEYEDYEIYSSKRRILLYKEDAAENQGDKDTSGPEQIATSDAGRGTGSIFGLGQELGLGL